MPGNRSNKTLYGYERDFRLAVLVSGRLRQLGYASRVIDTRDAHGMRLHPVNLDACGMAVLVRRASYDADWTQAADNEYRRAHPAALLQLGSRDIRQLVQACKLRTMKHWNVS